MQVKMLYNEDYIMEIKVPYYSDYKVYLIAKEYISGTCIQNYFISEKVGNDIFEETSYATLEECLIYLERGN